MEFIDNLAYSLFIISIAGFMLLYTMVSMYGSYKKGNKNFSNYLKSAGVPMTLLGLFMIVTGVWGQFTWPLPNSYNILFYDPLVSFGIVLLSFSIGIKYNTRLEYAGVLALLFGVMLMLYGFEGYNIGLTEEPIALLSLYLMYGAVGIFAFPVSLIADRSPGLKKNPWAGWTVILLVFLALLLFSSLLAAYLGYAAIGGHLLNPP
jgi:putative membrane protein